MWQRERQCSGTGATLQFKCIASQPTAGTGDNDDDIAMRRSGHTGVVAGRGEVLEDGTG